MREKRTKEKEMKIYGERSGLRASKNEGDTRKREYGVLVTGII